MAPDRRRQLAFAAFVCLVLFASVWMGFRAGSGPAERTRPSAATSPEPSNDIQPQNPAPTVEDHSPGGVLARIFGRLRAGQLASGELDALRRAILAAPHAEAIAAIVDFLASGQDALTGELFTVGTGGELSGAPTFRVLLLDLLGRICQETRTSEALTVSKALLETKTSADEWAIAMRNVGWATPQDRAYLVEKARELIRHQPWRQQPSAGFFEAMDVIVFARGVALIPDLSEMANAEDPALQASAAVALDRLAELAPLEAMTFLNQNQQELADLPFLRADYFSKADLSQPAQRQAVEMYLSRPDVKPQEKAKMLAVLASPGSFASETLLTDLPPEEFPPERIAGLRQTVADWLKTQRFPNLQGPLLQLQARIAD